MDVPFTYVGTGADAAGVRILAPEQRYFKHANRAYLDWAVAMGYVADAQPIVLQLYSEPLVITSYSIHYTKLYEFGLAPAWKASGTNLTLW